MNRHARTVDQKFWAQPSVSSAANALEKGSAYRFIARDWDQSLPPAEAAARVRVPAAWPTLAQEAAAARGHAM